MADALFFQYLRERYRAEVLANDNGFIAYKINGRECFLCEAFVLPERRRSGKVRELIQEMTVIALAADCDVITATVFIGDKNGNSTLIAAINIGFTVASADGGILVITKNIKEEPLGRTS